MFLLRFLRLRLGMAGQARNDSYLLHHADGDAVGGGVWIAGGNGAVLVAVVIEPGAPVVVGPVGIRVTAPVKSAVGVRQNRGGDDRVVAGGWYEVHVDPGVGFVFGRGDETNDAADGSLSPGEGVLEVVPLAESREPSA